MLAPDYYYDSVFMVPYNDLWQKNIRALIFDLDNTLAPYDVHRPTAKISALIKRLQRIGFTICLLTNNTEKRVRTYSEGLNVLAISGALKPLTTGINRALRELGAEKAQTAIIGDQLFSDIWGGRNAGITTIMVKPLSPKDIITVRWKRYPERLFMKAYFKKREAEKIK
jgi:HAD superfamily phosphatase (TIGR01668 family)